jgi:hypothetical protein
MVFSFVYAYALRDYSRLGSLHHEWEVRRVPSKENAIAGAYQFDTAHRGQSFADGNKIRIADCERLYKLQANGSDYERLVSVQ